MSFLRSAPPQKKNPGSAPAHNMKSAHFTIFCVESNLQFDKEVVDFSSSASSKSALC